MLQEVIVVRGAREHNLRDVELSLPKRQLIVLTGPSGSGKSSLAFDTLFTEGRRRYLESLSVYARQFIGEMARPAVSELRGLGPSIAIDQRTTTRNPRSTVGTITEIYDFMRVLWTHLGERPDASSEDDEGRLWRSGEAAIREDVLSLEKGTRFVVLSPLVRNRKGEFKDLIEKMRRGGFVRMRIDGEEVDLSEEIALRKQKRHDIDLVVDRLKMRPGLEKRIEDSMRAAFEASGGFCEIEVLGEKREVAYTLHFSSQDVSAPALSTQKFSFNSPLGMCKACQGLGTTYDMAVDLVIPDPSKSVKEGAIEAWGFKHQGRYPLAMSEDTLEGIAGALRMNLDKPFKKLTKRQKRIFLHGSEKPLSIKIERKGKTRRYKRAFGGVLGKLMDTYRSTHSEVIKGYLGDMIVEQTCPSCEGSRLNPEARGITVCGMTISAFSALPISDALERIQTFRFEGQRAKIAVELLPEIESRLRFLHDVGLGYLQLARSGPTLSGGESQRIRLASQLGSGLTGVTYILDEPSIGLHARDHRRLLTTLESLRDQGNTIIVVEHDRETMESADYLVDFGPGAGRHGGRVMYAGAAHRIGEAEGSLTGDYLSGRKRIEIPEKRRKGTGKDIVIHGARANNLQNIKARFPLGKLICVTGVSGAGKSTLVNSILLPAAISTVVGNRRQIGEHKRIVGLDALSRVIDIDQKPIGRTPRSNPATYTKVFDLIRGHFAQLPESRMYGYKPGRFSFNVKGGRCEVCKGSGVRTLEMQFLADVYVPCEVCDGKRYNEATLRVHYRGHSISDILKLPVSDALELFQENPPIRRVLQTLEDVGLGYIQLGQPSPTLSGGEAQRVKLSRELAKATSGHTLYILDEPSTGLHFEDIRHLLEVMYRLVDAGNTMVVIEHNMEIIQCADHVIDLGPEGGSGGGHIVAEGTPEVVSKVAKSHTGRWLVEALSEG